MRKVNILGKQVSVMFVALALMATFGSAALLPYFAQITTTVTASQSILVDGNDWDESITDTISDEYPSPNGESFCFKHILTSQVSVDADIGFETEIIPDDEGITTTYYTIPDELEETTIELSSKDSSTWTVTSDRKATLTYKTVDSKFDFTLEATGLDDESYTLVYYPDSGPTGVSGKPWTGYAVEIASGTASGGELSLSGTPDLGTHLPTGTDYNTNPDSGDSYCDGENGYDYYDHCNGAKFWLVKTTYYDDESETLTWNPDEWLFETDLGFYFDCDITELPSDYPIETIAGEPVTHTTVKSGEEKPFFVCHYFDLLLDGNTYTITTDVVPYEEV